MLKLCRIDMWPFNSFPSHSNFSFYAAFYLNRLCSFSYPAACPVAARCPWLLSGCFPSCAVFFGKNIFCFLLCCIFFPQFFSIILSRVLLACFLFCLASLYWLSWTLKMLKSSLKNIFRTLNFLNDVGSFLFCTQTIPIPCGVWKLGLHGFYFFFFIIFIFCVCCDLQTDEMLTQSNPCMRKIHAKPWQIPVQGRCTHSCHCLEALHKSCGRRLNTA